MYPERFLGSVLCCEGAKWTFLLLPRSQHCPFNKGINRQMGYNMLVSCLCVFCLSISSGDIFPCPALPLS